MEKGAEVNAVEYGYLNETALFNAVRYSSLDIVKFLINNGADINAKNTEGETALFYALGPHAGHAGFLVEAGADMNIISNKGQTALLYALDDFGYIDEDDNYIEYRVGAFSNVARLLIKKGMDINIKDNKGESALDKAISNKDEGLARVLVEAGAKK